MVKKIKVNIMKQIRYYCMPLYQYIRIYAKNRKQRLISYILLLPVFIFYFIYSFIYKNLLERFILRFGNDWNKKFENDLAIVAIVKNEGLYIREWIEFYRLLGVHKFYIFDNDSKDNILSVLDKYIQSNEVEYTYFPGRAKQLDAYNYCLTKYKKQNKYMAFIDLDEFIFPINGSLVSNLNLFFQENKNAGGVGINWLVYGSSGHKDKPKGLVLENYLYRAEDSADVNKCIKVICNPRRVQGFIDSPHNCEYKKGFFTFSDINKIIIGPWNSAPNNSYRLFRINHYYCKSEEEGRVKFERGLATDEVDIKRKWSEYNRFDQNEIFDNIASDYSLKLKDIIGD